MVIHHYGRKWSVLILAVFIMVTVAGCSVLKDKVEKDPFFEKWSALANASKGHSPARVPRKAATAKIKPPAGKAQPPKTEQQVSAPAPVEQKAPVTTEVASTPAPAPTETVTFTAAQRAEKRLPTERVRLTMRQADIKAVLRSLAKAVNLNILIKNDIKGDITVDFVDVPWDQAFNSIMRTQGLSYLWEGEVLRVMSMDDVEQELKVAALNERKMTQDMSVKLAEPLVTQVVNIQYADAKSMRENVLDFLTKDKDGKPHGSVKVDEHNNALIIQAIAADVDRIFPLIESLDKPTPQILIKADIVETTKDVARNLGIQWGGMYAGRLGNHDLFVTPGGFSGSTSANPTSGSYTPAFGSAGISGQGFGVNFPVSSAATAAASGSGSLGLIFGTIGGSLLEVQLHALQREGKVKILSSPSIT
ncbi:MAG: secretin N-terminal domain-containing protein, partial [Smithellaceae bacterium]|nr:secretin N-terminal domain-containing protein [Smithellaceae bacterium]